MTAEIQTIKPLLTDERGARDMLKCGATKLYELSKTELTTVKIGRATRWTVASIEKYVARLVDEAGRRAA